MGMTMKSDLCCTTLFTWFSPAFPTGGFGWSHGLETAVAEGSVEGEQGLLGWLTDGLEHGGAWNDAVLFGMAWRALDDIQRLQAVAELAAALAQSRERQAETLSQGRAFLNAVRTGWPELAPPDLPNGWAYPVAAGVTAAALGVDMRSALAAYLTGWTANLVAVGVRLSLCGQTGGVRILARAGPVIAGVAARAARSDEDDLGACAVAAEIASLRHEFLDGRLFLS